MKKTKKSTPAKTIKTPKRITTYPRVAGDAFVNQNMLYSVRDELIGHTEKKFQETEMRFHEVKAEIHEVKSVIHEVKANIAKLDKSVHKMALLMEEQNNRNKIVLDGLSQLFERQERVEKKLNSSF